MLLWHVLLRIFFATFLSAIIGYERDVHGRPAGLRTHIIVGLASATFMVVSTNFVYLQDFHGSRIVDIDASRIAASIVTGMGFLAGGAILRIGVTVQGLTTAAALWLVGAIGMAAGAGMFVVALFVTLLGVFALTVLRRFEDKDARRPQSHRLDLVLGSQTTSNEVLTALREMNFNVSIIAQERTLNEASQTLSLVVRAPREIDFEKLAGLLQSRSDVQRLRIELVT